MSTLSQLSLFHGDSKASAALRFGFEREGIQVSLVKEACELQSAIADGCQLVITGGRDEKEASTQLASLRLAIQESERRVPVLYFGNAISRERALEEGANEFLPQPAYLRDVITLGKLMATPMERRTQSISGELGEHFGLFYFVRAMGTIQYNGVLTLLRGLRRGEVRFYEGQPTSAQLGGLTGLSALHQMLLWSNARFDLREESVVHRRQIPLTYDEVLQDCERFLSEIRSIAGALSPSAVLEVDGSRDTAALPEPVKEVMRLFNGTSSVADVIEDSPFQNFETLRITCRLIEQAFVKQPGNQSKAQLSKTVLSIDEWLVSGQIQSGQSKPLLDAERGKPASPPGKSRNKKRRRNKKRNLRAPELGKPIIRNEKSWSDLLPTAENSEELAPVVPATAAAGEINVSSPSKRAKLRMADPEVPKRERMEERGGATLCKIFVDEDLSQDKPLGKQVEVFSWDEETSPAKRLAISDEPDVEESNFPLVNPMEDSEIQSESDTGLFAPKSEVQHAAKAVNSKEETDEGWDLESAKTKVVDTETFSPMDAKSSDEKSSDAETIPREIALAHKRVQETAADGVTAYRAAKKALALVPTSGTSEEVLKAEKTQDAEQIEQSKSTTEVEEVTASAEAATSEALEFSAEEEAFFTRGVEQAKAEPPPVENFEDLDEEYEIPKTFWGRFMSDPWRDNRKKKS